MRIKKRLVVIVAALAISSVMATMAYSGAYVQNPTTLKIASTKDSLVAINPGTGIGNLDGTSNVKDGVMYVNFGLGKDGEVYGLQPGSGYAWNNLFTATNNSKENVNYRITVSNENIVKHLTITDTTNNTVVFNQSNASPYVDFISGSTHSFKVEIWLHQNTTLEELQGAIQFNTYAK